MAENREGVEGGRAIRRVPLQLLFLAFLSASLTTCGIENITTFLPPVFVTGGSNLIQLTHNTGNNENSLKGYEIYYRAFSTLESADTARRAIEAATTSTTATPETCLSLLQTSGFSRMFDADGNDGPGGLRPLFTVSAANLSIALQYSILLDTTPPPSSAIDFIGNHAPNYQAIPYWYFNQSGTPDTHYAITRSISTPSTPISFESNYRANTDQTYDYTGAGAGISSTLYFVFFAVAYGIDTSSTSFNAINSFPASLYVSIPYNLQQIIQQN